jgi:hypothetical protein
MQDENWDAGYESGKHDGFNEGYADGHKDGSEAAEKEGYERGLEEGYEKGTVDGTDAENQRMEAEMSDIRYNFKQQLEDSHYTIKCLKEEIYKLRKENATITRTIQEST